MNTSKDNHLNMYSLRDPIYPEQNLCIDGYDYDPKKQVFVEINAIYSQIAKYSGNSKRKKEVGILVNALKGTNRKYMNAPYVMMLRNDFYVCFGQSTFMKRTVPM